MISDKKLRYYAHIADSAENEHVQGVIRQLVDEVVRLEREADWLAEKAIGCPMERTGPHDCLLDSNGDKWCDMCWREEARRAVSNE